MIEEIAYGGWKRNLRLRGESTELVITLDVGPRVIRYATHGGANVFAELSEQLGGCDEKEWMIRGGHRFWTAPEADHSYELDNSPVTWKKLGDTSVEIIQPASASFGFQKTLRVELLENELVRITHLLANASQAPLEMTPWALSVMAPGGTALIPQPFLDLHPGEFPEGREAKPEEFLPNRELVLWPFTNLGDGRYLFSKHFLRMSYAANLPATKLGLKLPSGWIAYQNGANVFAKYFTYNPALTYPDHGANCELYTDKNIFELESLANLQSLPVGGVREHIEHWSLHPIATDLRDEQAALDFFAALPKI